MSAFLLAWALCATFIAIGESLLGRKWRALAIANRKQADRLLATWEPSESKVLAVKIAATKRDRGQA